MHHFRSTKFNATPFTCCSLWELIFKDIFALTFQNCRSENDIITFLYERKYKFIFIHCFFFRSLQSSLRSVPPLQSVYDVLFIQPLFTCKYKGHTASTLQVYYIFSRTMQLF